MRYNRYAVYKKRPQVAEQDRTSPDTGPRLTHVVGPLNEMMSRYRNSTKHIPCVASKIARMRSSDIAPRLLSKRTPFNSACPSLYLSSRSILGTG